MNFRKLISLLSCTAALIVGAPANASIATYHIAGAFDSGSVVDGTFVYDNATKRVTSFLITVGARPDDGYCSQFCDGFAGEQAYSSAAGDTGALNSTRWISFTKFYEMTYTDVYGDEHTTQANDMFSLGFGNYSNCYDWNCPSTVGPLTATKLRVDLEENRTFYDPDYFGGSGALLSASRPSTSLGYYATLVSLVEPPPPVVTQPSRPAPVPEPGTLALMAAGVGLLVARRRRA